MNFRKTFVLILLLAGGQVWALCPPENPACLKNGDTFTDPSGQTFVYQERQDSGGDMMTQGQGTWVPVQEDKGDNFSCAKTPHDPACQNPQQTQPQPEVSAPTCARYASLQGGRSSSTFTCMCNNGGNYPNCKAPDGEESPDSRYEACKAQALQAISSCEGSYSSASSSCATTRVDGVVQQAQAENEQRLRQSENTAQTCGGTAQAYQNAANQLGSVQTSCQSSVNQCASNCAQAQSAVQQCPHSAVRARAQSVPTAQTSCTSGDLSRRPHQIVQTSSSLRDVGAREAANCNQGTSAAVNPSSGSGGLGNGTTNTSGGKLKQDAEKSMARSGPGVGGDVLGHLNGPSGSTGRSMESEAGPGSTGIDETYDVSGRNAATVTTGVGDLTAAHAALAALPGTPAFTGNGEDTDVQSEKAKEGQALAAAGAGGGRRGWSMPISRKAGANGVEETQALKAAGVAVEDPDLSAFLPGGQRRVAGGILPGLSGCRIPNPQKPDECAVPHGPSANIWSKMKERFEEFRFMRPAQFFMNEE